MTSTPAAADLLQSYAGIRRRLLSDLGSLTRWIAAEQKAGRPVSRARLLRQQRFRDLLTQTAVQMDGLAKQIEAQVITASTAAANKARIEAVAAIQKAMGPGPAGVSMSFNTLPVGAVNDITARLAPGQPLRALLDSIPGDTTAAIREIVTGIGLGKGPRVTAAAVRKVLDIRYTRALVIVRQEQMQAFRSSSLSIYAANRGIVKKWRWVCALQPRTCGLCWSMHGKEFDLDVPFASHIACRCAAAPVTASWEEILGFTNIPDTRPEPKTGAELFAALSESDQLEILRPSKFRLWKAGQLSLKDLVVMTHSKIWGPGRREKTLRELTAGK